jgi:hypothetical protein
MQGRDLASITLVGRRALAQQLRSIRERRRGWKRPRQIHKAPALRKHQEAEPRPVGVITRGRLAPTGVNGGLSAKFRGGR